MFNTSKNNKVNFYVILFDFIEKVFIK